MHSSLRLASASWCEPLAKGKQVSDHGVCANLVCRMYNFVGRTARNGTLLSVERLNSLSSLSLSFWHSLDYATAHWRQPYLGSIQHLSLCSCCASAFHRTIEPIGAVLTNYVVFIWRADVSVAFLISKGSTRSRRWSSNHVKLQAFEIKLYVFISFVSNRLFRIDCDSNCNFGEMLRASVRAVFTRST